MAAARHTYELTYIINAVISDDQIKDIVGRVASYITESGGEIIHSDEWGTRRLSFPIQKKRNGYYVNLYFVATGAIIARLERALEIDDNILRYLTLRMDSKMIRHFERNRSSRAAAAASADADRAERSERSERRKAAAIPRVSAPKADESDEGDDVSVDDDAEV
jgi:small subunit ribosomal protein S6